MVVSFSFQRSSPRSKHDVTSQSRSISWYACGIHRPNWNCEKLFSTQVAIAQDKFSQSNKTWRRLQIAIDILLFWNFGWIRILFLTCLRTLKLWKVVSYVSCIVRPERFFTICKPNSIAQHWSCERCLASQILVFVRGLWNTVFYISCTLRPDELFTIWNKCARLKLWLASFCVSPGLRPRNVNSCFLGELRLTPKTSFHNLPKQLALIKLCNSSSTGRKC